MQPPNWHKTAVISPNGWRHERTGELLVCRKFSDAQISEHNAPISRSSHLRAQPNLAAAQPKQVKPKPPAPKKQPPKEEVKTGETVQPPANEVLTATKSADTE